MRGIALQLEHSVEIEVGREFAWSFQTDVGNWSDPPAIFSFDGPFVAGSRGTTLLPGQEALQWSVQDVHPITSYAIEMQLDGATLTFSWCFDSLSEHKTRLTQTIVLSGENASSYVTQVQAGFGPNLSDGMKRIATEMTAAEKRFKGAG
jgi:hypothetical protein